jgi:hypothetical protein
MKRHLLLAACVAAGLLSAQAASATTLVSTSLSIAGKNVLQCSIVNIGPVPGTVTIVLLDPGGVKTWDSGPVAIAPGQNLVDTASKRQAQADNYCAFEVTGPAASYRAAAENVEPGGGTVAVAPAQ